MGVVRGRRRLTGPGGLASPRAEVARRERPDEGGWVRRALASAGRPIVANALGVPVGLTALWLSPLAPHTHIAAFMWVAMLTSAAATLVVVPAFAPRRGVRPAAGDPVASGG